MENLELENLGFSELKAEEMKQTNGGCWDNFCLVAAVSIIMRPRSFAFSTIFLLIIHTSFSQKIIESSLVDRESNKPVSQAHIFFRNEINGTVSNDDGKFRIVCPAGFKETDSIMISHINYIPTYTTIRNLITDGEVIYLKENAISLDQISVTAKEDDGLLGEIITQSKRNINFPLATKIYYREWVKENKSYNRFADGLLDITYGVEDKDIAIKVDQSRAYKLPKDDDEMFEMASPLKIEYVLNNQYINFLNRFDKEKKASYHFYAFPDTAQQGAVTLVIEPKKIKLKESEDKIFYKAIINTDKQRNITEAVLELDSMSNYDKSILGLKMKVLHSKMTYKFINKNGTNYLSYMRADYVFQFTFRKKTQIDNYTSEFLLQSASKQYQDIPKDQRFKKSSLYKNGNKFNRNYWEDANMPFASKEEMLLLEKLKE